MKVIAVYNIKGGVGKTTTAVNLSFLAALQGHNTLLWDLDSQAASSFYLRIQPKLKGGSRALVKGKSALHTFIKGTDFENFDLLPADFSARNLDLILDDSKKPTRRLSKLLQPLASEYDYIFLDCPPGMSLLSEAILHAADYIVCPLIPTTLSVRTLTQLQDFLNEQELNAVNLIPFFSLVDRRKKMHLDLLASLREHTPTILNSTIPYASDIERMGEERNPLPVFAGKSKAAAAYQALWQEIALRMHESR